MFYIIFRLWWSIKRQQYNNNTWRWHWYMITICARTTAWSVFTMPLHNYPQRVSMESSQNKCFLELLRTQHDDNSYMIIFAMWLASCDNDSRGLQQCIKCMLIMPQGRMMAICALIMTAATLNGQCLQKLLGIEIMTFTLTGNDSCNEWHTDNCVRMVIYRVIWFWLNAAGIYDCICVCW